MKLPQAIPGKRCAKCRKVLPLETFTKDGKRRDGKSSQCRYCTRIYQRAYAARPRRKAQIQSYYKSSVGQRTRRRSKLKQKYGLTVSGYEAILTNQGGLCAVCRRGFRDTRDTHIDHCHSSGIVRGILCGDCNRALGGARDSIEVLGAMIDYLKGAQ